MKKVNVNLGCGSNMAAGFVNIDVVRPDNADKSFKLGDARHIPMHSGSVDYIILDQVLEHIPMADIVPVLFEIRRVLKVGGRAVIIVPDFRSAIEDWQKIDHDTCFNPLVFQYLSEVIYGNQLHEGEYHKTPMTAGFLNYALNTAGMPTKKLTIHPANSPVPMYPGVRPFPPTALCRNAQLVAEVTKTA